MSMKKKGGMADTAPLSAIPLKKRNLFGVPQLPRPR